MINFDHRTGPQVDDPAVYPQASVPQWWRDAKLGIFIHWGIYSVPAFAETPSTTPPVHSERDAYVHHQYAEWFANTCRFPESRAAARLREIAGEGDYESLVNLWHAEDFDAPALAQRFRQIGARYVIPTSKHHDGYCLWPTQTTDFSVRTSGPRRDLIGELTTAVRDHDMRAGLYFSGILDWHRADRGVMESNDDLFTKRDDSPEFASFAAAQLRELIAAYQPSVIWNDIDWPDAGKVRGPDSLGQVLSEYFARVPDGVINDRFGAPVHGFLTREYSIVDDDPGVPWEATRGIGRSFGYNANETRADIMSAEELVSYFSHVLVRGGNLLLNIGLTAEGRIPSLYDDALDALADFTSAYGEAIYGCVPAADLWAPTANSGLVRNRATGELYLHVQQGTAVEIPGLRAAWRMDGTPVTSSFLTGDAPLPVRVFRVEMA